MPLRRRRLAQNRLPVAPPPLRSRAHSPSARSREDSLARVRRVAREHQASERPFEPEKRGSWRGSSGDLVVNGSRYERQNPAHARRGAKHVADEPSEDFLVIEESDNDRYPFVVVNPTDYDSFMSPVIFAFAFGAYGWTRLIVWGQRDHLEDALELAADWLSEHAPGILTTFEEEGALPSWEWHVSEFGSGDLYNVTREASAEET